MDIRVNRETTVVFDLDDTLYNEIDYLKSAYRYIARQLEGENWKPLYASMFSRYRNKEDVFGYLKGAYNTRKEVLLEMYRNHDPQIVPFEGVIDLLKQIKEQGAGIGIITDGRKRSQMNKINALGVGQYIDQIVISEEVGTEKPNERNYRLIEEGLPADRYYYIADNLKKDFITPNSLGWSTIGLLDNGMNIHSDTYRFMDTKYMPQAFISSLKEIRITN